MSEPQRNPAVDSLEAVDGRDHEKMEGRVATSPVHGFFFAWCPRFASFFRTLTWAEEGSDVAAEHRNSDVQDLRPSGCELQGSQVSPTEGRTWGTNAKAERYRQDKT